MERGKGNVIVFDKYSTPWLMNLTEEAVDLLYKSFDYCYYQLDLSEFKADRRDIEVLNATKDYFDNIYDSGDFPPVLISDCYYLDKDDAKNKIILNKIADGAAHYQSNDQYFKDLDEQWDEISKVFDVDKWDVQNIFDYACENTVVITNKAQAKFDTTRNFMPRYSMTQEEKEKYGDTHTMFLKLIEEGFRKLVPKDKEQEYLKRVRYETYVLESTDNIDYMLVQYDTCNWARKNNILVGVGRGSAGGCLIVS